MRLDRLVVPAAAVTFAAATSGFLVSPTAASQSATADIDTQPSILQEIVTFKTNTEFEPFNSTTINTTNQPIINTSIYNETINHNFTHRRKERGSTIDKNDVQDLDQLAIPINKENFNHSLNSSALFARSSSSTSRYSLEDERLKRRLRRNISSFEKQVDNTGHGFASGRAATPIVLHESLLLEDGDNPSLRPRPLMMTKSPEGYYVLNNITLRVCILEETINYTRAYTTY